MSTRLQERRERPLERVERALEDHFSKKIYLY